MKIKKFNKYKQVTQIAAKDIADDNRQNRKNGKWIISNDDVFTKKSKKLNKELGLHNINKKDNIKNVDKKKNNDEILTTNEAKFNTSDMMKIYDKYDIDIHSIPNNLQSQINSLVRDYLKLEAKIKIR